MFVWFAGESRLRKSGTNIEGVRAVRSGKIESSPKVAPPSEMNILIHDSTFLLYILLIPQLRFLFFGHL
jgi:hypothetical protein